MRRRPALVALTALLLALVPAGAQAASPLVGQWHLDSKHVDAGKDVVDDSSGTGNNLTGPQNGVLIDTNLTKFGGALTTGNANVLKSVSDGPAPTKVTLMAWIKQNGDPGVLKYIAGRGDDGDNICSGSSYALYTGYNAKPGLHFYVRIPGSPFPGSVLTEAPATNKVFDNQWHLVTGTYDGGDAKLYVDGTLISTVAGAAPIEYDLPGHDGIAHGGGKQFYVDGYPQPTCGNADFPGRIDEVRVYDRALSATEIGRLAAAPAGPTAPDLVPDPTPAPGDTPTPAPTPTPEPARLSRPSFAPISAADETLPGTTTLDASASVNVDRFDWDLGGDGRTDVSCPGDQPVLQVSTTTSATKPVSLSTFGGGTLASAPAKLTSGITLRNTVGLPTGRKQAGGTLKQFPHSLLTMLPDVATCSDRRLSATSLAGGAKINDLCIKQTVIWSLASASGCFRRKSDPSDVPPGERALIAKHYDSFDYAQTVVVLCNMAARGEKPQSLCDQAKAMFKQPYDVYVGVGQVDLNGIKITPANGTEVVIFPKLQRIVASNATMKWGRFTVRTGALDFNFVNDPASSGFYMTGSRSQDCACGRSSAIARYDGTKDLPNLAGFKINGYVDLALTGVNGQRYASGVMSATLPDEFGIFGTGNPPSGRLEMTSQNGKGPSFDGLTISVPQAQIGPLRLADVKFQFASHGHIDGDSDPNSTCDANEWKAQAKVFLAGGNQQTGEAGFILAPPPSQNGLGFCDGDFHHFGGSLVFGGPIPRPQIFPGVFLNHIDFAMQLNPFLARGGVGIDVADIAHVDGTLLFALATPQQPYTLTPADAGNTLSQLAGRKLTSTTIMAGGAVSLKFPEVGMIPVGSAAAMWSYPDHVAARGEVRVQVPGMAIYGYAAIEALFQSGQFTASIGGKACLGGVKSGACIGGDGWVTHKGIVACLNIFDEFHPGAGLNWSTRKVEIWPLDGCKPSHYWVTFSAASATRARRLGTDDTRTFKIVSGEGVKNIRIAAASGGVSPKVKLTSPDGEVLTVDGDDWTRSAHMIGVRYDDQTHVVYLGVKDGKPGTYTVEQLPGSSPLGEMAVTKDGFESDFDASVSGANAGAARAAAARTASAARASALVTRGQRTLHYNAGKKGGGQTVQFIEQGADGTALQTIGTVNGGKGTLRFTPADGPSGKRNIVAQATIDGTPAAPQIVGSYTFGGVKRLAAPRGIKAVRQGRTVVVTWNAVVGADQYGVLLKLKSGQERQFTVKGGQHRLVIKEIDLWESGKVQVTARDGSQATYGKTGTSNGFKATAPVPSVLQTKSKNEKKGNF